MIEFEVAARRNRSLEASLLALAIGFPHAATAQSSSPVSAPVQALQPQAATDQNNGIGDIVVTAQRRNERLQDVPIAITALSERQLAQAGVQDTRDIQLVTPSLNFVQSTFTPQPTIRGIGTRGANPGDEEVVPTYVDGVYQPFITGGLFELANIERVEVLKGPQGTLLGRNATAGAINIITKAPSFEPGGKVVASYGRFNELQGSLYLTGGTGHLAGSIVAQYLDDDGYVTELTTNTRTASQHNYLVRGKLLFQPDGDTDITLAAGYFKRKDTTIANFPLNGNTVARQIDPNVPLAYTNRQVRLTEPPQVAMSQTSFSGTLVHRFSGATLTSITGYSENMNNYRLDLDMSPLAIQTQSAHQYDNGLTEDLYLASSDKQRFSWVIGGFYIHDDSGFKPRTVNTSSLKAALTLRAFALYAQGSYKLTDALTVTAGARYSNDRKCGAADNYVGTQTLPRTCKTWTSVDPSFTLDWRASEKLKLYARYAQAYKAGVFNAPGFSPVPADPEHVKSYELGLKSDPAPWLRINVAGYYTDYRDIQVNSRDPVSNAVILQNAAKAEIYGGEAEIVVQPTSGLNLRVGVSALSATYKQFPNAQVFVPRPGGGNVAAFVDAANKPLLRTPQRSGNAGIDYTFAALSGQVTIGANAYYQGPMNFTVDGRLRQPEYAIVNAQLTWRSSADRFEIALWGRNITDVRYPLQVVGFSTGDLASYMRPATYGIRGTINF
ncbi:TonB-dependent receptor [Sphingomonas sp. CL5.1]|uniref:TonB-dependent receptor n=1 Tax=Sphingomonas sp. CL5.1 TaxID=2653203 RepID=UPI00158380A8|nr:TonB-dependent receptor [Sphingomonas sp. CL5.1]QKR99273.1 TonB-dependent receptor [Sphingomonas sp. CL5.1]